MKQKLNIELPNEENPEWTAEDVNSAVPFVKLSEVLQAKIKKRARGTQVAPTKERITIRLSPAVVKTFKATGAGWQTRLDAALQDWLKNHAL